MRQITTSSFILLSFLLAQGQCQSIGIELYYETLCQQSQLFIQNQLWPVYQKYQNYIELIYFNPYGKAKRLNDDPYNLRFECEHGEAECRLGIQTFCYYNLLLAYMGDNDPKLSVLTWQALKQIHCAESSANPSSHDNFEKCFNSVPREDLFNNLTWVEVNNCASGQDGHVGFGMSGLITDMLDPPLTQTPYIRINETYTESMNNAAMVDLEKVLCAYFLGFTPECQGPVTSTHP